MKIGFSYTTGSGKYRLYVDAVLEAGLVTGAAIEPYWLGGAEAARTGGTIDTVDGVVLTGGSDVAPHRYGLEDADRLCSADAERDAVEWSILERALERRIPILAICRGAQLLNVVRGGTLVPHLATTATHRLDDAERHAVAIDTGSTLAQIAGTTTGAVTSSHHQAVDRLGDGLRAVAHHADGTIEAIEWAQPHQHPWLVAVQWHPERMALDEPLAGPLFRGFLSAVAARAALA